MKRKATYLLAVAMVFACRAAEACNMCKQAMASDGEAGGAPARVSGAGVGYALSIGVLLCMVAGIIGGLGVMMYRNCRAIAEAQARAAMSEGRA